MPRRRTYPGCRRRPRPCRPGAISATPALGRGRKMALRHHQGGTYSSRWPRPLQEEIKHGRRQGNFPALLCPQSPGWRCRPQKTRLRACAGGARGPRPLRASPCPAPAGPDTPPNVGTELAPAPRPDPVPQGRPEQPAPRHWPRSPAGQMPGPEGSRHRHVPIGALAGDGQAPRSLLRAGGPQVDLPGAQAGDMRGGRPSGHCAPVRAARTDLRQ